MATWLTTTSFKVLLVRFYKVGAAEPGQDPQGEAIVQKHMDRAEGVVMGALARMYEMPFTSVPPEARRIAEDIASYYIIRASNFQDGKQKNVYLAEFKDAFEDLENLTKGETKLTYTDGSLVPVKTSARYSSSTENYTPIFGLDEPEDWQRDANEIEDQAARRE